MGERDIMQEWMEDGCKVNVTTKQGMVRVDDCVILAVDQHGFAVRTMEEGTVDGDTWEEVNGIAVPATVAKDTFVPWDNLSYITKK